MIGQNLEKKCRNGGKLYFEMSHQISEDLNKYIQTKICNLKLSAGLEETLLELPKKRRGKVLMRSSLTYLVYKNLGGEKDYSQLTSILAVSELSNYYAYLDNWIFDNKNGCNNDPDKIKKITIASQILRELAQDCVEESEILERTKREISKRLSKATKRCYEGQFRDLEMSIDKLDSFESYERYLKEYMEKSKLQSGSLYGFSGAIGAILAGAEEKVVSSYEEYSSLYGMGIHVSNDLGDFAIAHYDGSFKPYGDQLADIINGRLSFPIYYVLSKGSKVEKDNLMSMEKNVQASMREKVLASKAVLDSGAYRETRKILNSICRDLKREIRDFPDNDFRAAISSMRDTIVRNKYLKDLKKLSQ